MLSRALVASFVAVVALVAVVSMAPTEVQAARPGQPDDWQRFYYYPYVYYPHNFQKKQPSSDSLYYRYPASRRIPVYNKNWYNFYPSDRPYHSGHHFIIDVF